MAHPRAPVPFGGPSRNGGGPEVTGPKGYARRIEYPEDRCANCPHLVYPNHKPGDPCLAAVVYDPPRCKCTEHHVPVKTPSGDAA